MRLLYFGSQNITVSYINIGIQINAISFAHKSNLNILKETCDCAKKPANKM